MADGLRSPRTEARHGWGREHFLRTARRRHSRAWHRKSDRRRAEDAAPALPVGTRPWPPQGQLSRGRRAYSGRPPAKARNRSPLGQQQAAARRRRKPVATESATCKIPIGTSSSAAPGTRSTTIAIGTDKKGSDRMCLVQSTCHPAGARRQVRTDDQRNASKVSTACGMIAARLARGADPPVQQTH